MRDVRKTLVLLTTWYPFGRAVETFLDAELPVLARWFEQIILVPSFHGGDARSLSPNVRCETLLADTTRAMRLRELLRHPQWMAFQFSRALVEEGSPRAYLRHPGTFAAYIGSSMLKFRLLKEFLDTEGLHDAVFYDYWLDNSTLALSWLRRRGLIHRAVARAHGADLYDERSELGAIPFRAFNVASLDRVVAISRHGQRYLQARHPGAHDKLWLSRLGVEPHEPHRGSRGEQRNLVVSCGGLVPIKRVHLIPEVLAKVDLPLRWVHFGDGPCRAQVEQAAATLPERVSWQLVGHVDRSELFDFYRSNPIDLFISLSASEGLPVSMMEAISFGIPILASSVGGVPELVTRNTGRLVDVDDRPAEIASAARELLGGQRPSSREILEFFEANFSAERNFGEFARMLRAL